MFYNQIDGVAMGSALAPVFANIFMGFYISKWLNEYNLNKHTFYLKYVDHILAAFDKEPDSLNVLIFLNNRHPNIKFTIEKQIDHSIAFLDVFISGINNKFSLIKCLIDRSFKIYINWNSFHNDIENIKSNLTKNVYPPFLILQSLKSH